MKYARTKLGVRSTFVIARQALVLSILACPAVAVAQTPEPPANPPTNPPPANAPAAAEPPTSASEPAPAPAPAAPAAAAKPEAAPEPAPAPAVDPEKPWYQRIELGAFVDAYYSLNARYIKPNAGVNLYHPYNTNAGFGLAWAGLDASLAPEPVGGTIQLRLGPSVPYLALGDSLIPGGVGNLQNAFVSYRPGGKEGKLTLSLGKFDTLYGAEVAQSQLNMNYTRGVVYNLAQPFFHTGLRAEIAVLDELTVRLLAVNGWNNTIDNNTGKSFGAQVTYAPADTFSVTAGFLTGPEQNNQTSVDCATDTAFDAATGGCVPSVGTAASSTKVDVPGAEDRWRVLADMVVDFRPSASSRILVNGTYVQDQLPDATGAMKTVRWGGVALMGRYAFTDVFATAVRGEALFDPDGQITLPNTSSLDLYTATWTLEAAASKYLLFRLDSRLDVASAAVFPTDKGINEKTQITFTFGAVAKTN